LRFRLHRQFVHHPITRLLALQIKNNYRVRMKLFPIESRIHCLEK
jgi:hypothetical protein